MSMKAAATLYLILFASVFIAFFSCNQTKSDLLYIDL